MITSFPRHILGVRSWRSFLTNFLEPLVCGLFLASLSCQPLLESFLAHQHLLVHITLGIKSA